MPGNLSQQEAKEALKEALKEWLDAQFATFGKWSFASFMAVVFSGIMYLALHALGWHH